MMLARAKAWIRAWVARNIIADDPSPEYSRLDRLDGLPRA